MDKHFCKLVSDARQQIQIPSTSVLSGNRGAIAAILQTGTGTYFIIIIFSLKTAQRRKIRQNLQ